MSWSSKQRLVGVVFCFFFPGKLAIVAKVGISQVSQAGCICNGDGMCCQVSLAVQVAFYLIDLLQDDNAEVVKAADQALAVISETDESWAAKLRALKFEAHNQVWLEACADGVPQQVDISSDALDVCQEQWATEVVLLTLP